MLLLFRGKRILKIPFGHGKRLGHVVDSAHEATPQVNRWRMVGLPRDFAIADKLPQTQAQGIVHGIPQRHVTGSPHVIKLHRDIVVKG